MAHQFTLITAHDQCGSFDSLAKPSKVEIGQGPKDCDLAGWVVAQVIVDLFQWICTGLWQDSLGVVKELWRTHNVGHLGTQCCGDQSKVVSHGD